MDRTVRLLLTMLALFAGFGSAPAQARIVSPDAAGVERVEGSGVLTTAALATAEVQTTAGSGRTDRVQPKPKPTVTTIVIIPTIQFGDRARE
jgi:hypothetical protein